MKAEEWAEIVQGLAAKRRGSPTSRSAASTRGAVRRPSARAAPTGSRASCRGEFWGAACDADEHEEGGLFSKTVLPRRDPRQGPHARPREGRPDLQRRVDRGRRAGRAARESGARSSSSRSTSTAAYLATVPADHDPIALRELFSPGFLDWAAQIRNEVDFGITDRQLYFIWRLGERSAERVRRRRSTPPAGCSRACATRWRSTDCTPTRPGPWHAGLEPFPDQRLGQARAARLRAWRVSVEAPALLRLRRKRAAGALRQLEAADQLVRDERPAAVVARPGRRGPGSSPARRSPRRARGRSGRRAPPPAAARPGSAPSADPARVAVDA